MTTIKIIVLASLLFIINKPIQNESEVVNHCLTQEEMKLYALINNYRKEKRLPLIPLSKSLSYVARQHVIDLQYNVKETTHSWSDCKYINGKHDSYNCMWLKPQELTSYKGKGYECVFGKTPEDVQAHDALNAWKKSPNHNNVIINKGIWAQVKWQAIGVGIYKNYAAIWFGEEHDKEDLPIMCE